MIDTIINHGNKHIACVLLVDTSGSMNQYGAIHELNDGLRVFGEALQKDGMAAGCADICVVKFDSTVEVVFPFASATEYQAPVLEANGLTAMNEAIIAGLDLLEQRKQEYRTIGVDYWRPWMFLLTDGVPTDTKLSADAHSRLQEALEKKKLTFFPMGIGEAANIAELKTYTKDGSGVTLKAEIDQFAKAFQWLSNSVAAVGGSTPGTRELELPPIPGGIVIDL